MKEIVGKYTTARLTIAEVEPACLQQIETFCNHPAFTNPIVMMPDTHAGAGVPIGFCMKMADKVIPNVIGVDIGCGMLALNVAKTFTNFDQATWGKFDKLLRRKIPTGMALHEKSLLDMRREFPWGKIEGLYQRFAVAYGKHTGINWEIQKIDYDWFTQLCAKIHSELPKVIKSLGTLGGGNHFIEVGKSQHKSDYWITIHSGSRNFGLRVAKYHQSKAQKNLKQSFATDSKNLRRVIFEKGTNQLQRQEQWLEASKSLMLPKQYTGLEWLEGPDALAYMLDMIFAQAFAQFNRELIKQQILDVLEDMAIKVEISEEITSVHNFIDFEDWIMRKGAIRSYKGEKSIIPFNMRDGSLLTEGKSNAEWHSSAPHGAGRVLSRGKAKSSIPLKTFEAQMKGIFSTSVCSSTLDEAPMAYKDARLIAALIKPTAEIVDKVIPVYNLKDTSSATSWKEKRVDRQLVKKHSRKKEKLKGKQNWR